MQYKIFSVSTISGEQEEERMNKFIRSVKVVATKSQFCQNADMEYWTFCITYMPTQKSEEERQRKTRIDYREVLGENEFAKFAEMRKVRKTISERISIPAYAVFTDAELAEMAKVEEASIENFMKIDGISEKQMNAYGAEIIAGLEGYLRDRE